MMTKKELREMEELLRHRKTTWLERNATLIVILFWIIVAILILGCNTTNEVKKCCEKTAQEVYEYEGWTIDNVE